MSDTVAKLKSQYKKMRYNALNDLLGQLTKEQVEKFNKIFYLYTANGKTNIPESKLDDAIRLCEKTVEKNTKDKLVLAHRKVIKERGCDHKAVEGHKFCTECGKLMWIESKFCGLCNNTRVHANPEDPHKMIACECCSCQL